MTDDEARAALEAGRAAWADGADMPPMPESDAATPEALYWAGFIEARAYDWFRRRAMALYPDTVEPRPPCLTPSTPQPGPTAQRSRNGSAPT